MNDLIYNFGIDEADIWDAYDNALVHAGDWEESEGGAN